MNQKIVSNQGKGGGVPSRDVLYRKVAKKAEACIDYLIDIVEGRQLANSVKMGAARILLNKVLPDIKVQETRQEPDRPLGVVILPALKNEVIKENELENQITL